MEYIYNRKYLKAVDPIIVNLSVHFCYGESYRNFENLRNVEVRVH